MQDRDFIYDDLNRELVNHFPFGLVDSYDEFITVVLSAIQRTLNSQSGQDLIEPLRQEAIRTNMSPEAWRQKKVDIMVTLFFLVVDSLPMLKHEMARHLYRELRKES